MDFWKNFNSDGDFNIPTLYRIVFNWVYYLFKLSLYSCLFICLFAIMQVLMNGQAGNQTDNLKCFYSVIIIGYIQYCCCYCHLCQCLCVCCPVYTVRDVMKDSFTLNLYTYLYIIYIGYGVHRGKFYNFILKKSTKSVGKSN